MAIGRKFRSCMGGGGYCLLIIIPPSDHSAITGEPYYPAARSNRSVTQCRSPVSYRESLDEFLPVSSITLSYQPNIHVKGRVSRPRCPARGLSRGALVVMKLQFERLEVNFRRLVAYLGRQVQHAYAAFPSDRGPPRDPSLHPFPESTR